MDAPLIDAADLPDEDDLTGQCPDAQAEKLVQLRNGGVDVIDHYYIHRIDPHVPIEETVGAMARLVEQG